MIDKNRSQVDDISAYFTPVGAPDLVARAAATARIDDLTKPLGSLGRLEEIGIALAGICHTTLPDVSRPATVVFAADHGVAEERVSAYPQEVTREMLANFDRGGAAINAISERVGSALVVVDVGVIAPPPNLSRVRYMSVAAGTRNIAREAAMSEKEALRAIAVGVTTTVDLIKAAGVNLLVFGDMGIANTTPASAITAVICDRQPDEVTGPGTGLLPPQVAEKVHVVERAIRNAAADRSRPFEVLRTLGGLEIAAIVGGILAASHHRIPVILDGFITGAAALIADSLAVGSRQYLLAGHLSPEPGHQVQLEYLGLFPILDLSMRLGEGTGGTLAIPIVQAASDALRKMATFSEAAVSHPGSP